MARLTRKEMKRDEVLEAVGSTVRFVGTYQKPLLMALAALVVLALAGVAVWIYLDFQEGRGQTALDHALKVYRAPIDATAPEPDNEDDPSFADSTTRDAEALELLEQVHSRYGSTTAGDLAGVYLAEIAMKEGDMERARSLWTRFVERHLNHFIAASVQLNLISLDRQQGKADELEARLREALDDENRTLPEDVVLYELAITLEEVGSEDEAKETFQRLVDEFPRSPYAAQAQQRLGPPQGSGNLLPFGT